MNSSIFNWNFSLKKEIILPRKFRTVTSGIPSIAEGGWKHENGNGNSQGNGHLPETNGKEKEAQVGSLLTRQALKTYETANHMIFYKYSVYGGTCGDLPRYEKSSLARNCY